MSMNYQEYIVPMISAGVYLLLLIIKPFLKENSKYLPLIAGILGVGLNAWANMRFDFAIFLEGLASGLGSTGIDQLVKQITNHYYVEDNEEESVDIIEIPIDEDVEELQEGEE